MGVTEDAFRDKIDARRGFGGSESKEYCSPSLFPEALVLHKRVMHQVSEHHCGSKFQSLFQDFH